MLSQVARFSFVFVFVLWLSNIPLHIYIYIYIYIYTHTHTMEYYSVIKKNEIMPFAATWIHLEAIIISEVSQKEKDKYHMISLVCGI